MMRWFCGLQADSTARLMDIRGERKRDKRVEEVEGRKRREGAMAP